MLVYTHYPVDVCDDEDGDTVAACDLFPQLRGYGDDTDEAVEDLADEIADCLRNTVMH